MGESVVSAVAARLLVKTESPRAFLTISPMIEGKNVVITGGTGRLGSRLVRRFRSDGAHVASVARHASHHTPSTSGEHAYGADLTDEADVERTFRAIASDMGGIDALVHAVGSWALTPLSTTSASEWDDLLRTNLLSTFLCFHEASRYLEAGGTLIAFASAQGTERGTAAQSAYSAAKAGVVRLVESTAAELADRGINAYTIAPSMILYDPDDEGAGIHVDELVELCMRLCTGEAPAMSGDVIRAYGS